MAAKDQASENFQYLPKQGQLVEVRRRKWVVAEVSTGSLVSDSPKNTNALVQLVSVDENCMGEELQVVWSLEPGARVLERAGLPTLSGVDDPAVLESFLDAVRWGAATSADKNLLQSPFRSGISIESYQLDPVVRAINMARVNLLIADDVGLGKTIEAGLVIQELLVRHRARTVLVVCPSSLQLKWQQEMLEKFGLEFRIVDTDYLRAIRREQGIHANPWNSFPRLITSMDWMKSGEALHQIKDLLPAKFSLPRKFDLLVIDEAHNVAPAMATHYAIESQRTSLVRKISPHFEHRIFLSATPHNGYQESFTSLLELLDDQRFARNIMPDERQLQRVMVRRLKTDICDESGKPVFLPREIKALEVAYTDDERKAHELLRRYAKTYSATPGTVEKAGKAEKGSQFILNLLKKRMFSSPRGFSITLEAHRESLAGRGRKKESTDLDDRILRKAIAKLDEDSSSDVGLETAMNEAVEAAAKVARDLTPEQVEILEQLSHWASSAKNRPDSKAQAILHWIGSHLKTNGEWNDSRVILFTEYRATHSWLMEILAASGLGGDRVMQLHGALDPEERAKVMAAFQSSPSLSPVRILLATDAASEGIDLQNHCNYLIHVEIPWNPNVMEQRNGRIDRHGQKKTPTIWHPVGKGFSVQAADRDLKVGELDGDHEYLMRAVLKLETIREDLGSVGPVIATQIQEAMGGKTNRLDTREAEAKAAKTRRFVTAEKMLKEKIAKLHERLMEAREDFHLSADRVAAAVQTGLRLAGKPALIRVSWPRAPENSVFEVPQLSGTWLQATVGLNHPHTFKRRPITFDGDVARGRDDVVLAHLNHRLVQMCLRILRAEVWSMDDLKSIHRVAVRRTDDPSVVNPILIVTSRLVIAGGSRHLVHEEVTISGGELKQEAFARIPQIGRLEALLGSSAPTQMDEATSAMLKQRYEKFQSGIITAAEARSKERLESLYSSIQRKKEADISDISTLLRELETALKSELEDYGKLKQAELWQPDEKLQVRRDADALRARLARIPSETQEEIRSIETRYSNLSHRTFPVAVTFLLPSKK